MRPDPIQPLTVRELAVAERVGRGLSYKEVGRELGLSDRTVEHYAESAACKIPGSGPPKIRLILWWLGVAA